MWCLYRAPVTDTCSNVNRGYRLTLVFEAKVRAGATYHLSLCTSLRAWINMADRKKSRDRGRERPVTGRCVACSEGHCWSYERTMHCPRPEYSPYQLTSHYQHCCCRRRCPITIPTALTHTHTDTHTHGHTHTRTHTQLPTQTQS